QIKSDFLDHPAPTGRSGSGAITVQTVIRSVPTTDGPKPRKFKSLSGAIEVNFRPDPNLWDGRFANNGWLQECPKPMSKLTWDNAALISPALAQRHGLTTDDVIELNFEGRALRAPVWIMPGQAENSIALHLGYGRERVGRVGAG